jgi:hypothetical protein
MLYESYEDGFNCCIFENRDNSGLPLLHMKLNETLNTNSAGDSHHQFLEHIAKQAQPSRRL